MQSRSDDVVLKNRIPNHQLWHVLRPNAVGKTFDVAVLHDELRAKITASRITGDDAGTSCSSGTNSCNFQISDGAVTSYPTDLRPDAIAACGGLVEDGCVGSVPEHLHTLALDDEPGA